MLRIIGHIERLLLRNDCVIIPQWGGFVLREVPASCDEEGVWFYPARKEISFNTSLRHTDGLLAESYMQVLDLSMKVLIDGLIKGMRIAYAQIQSLSY